MNYFRWLWMTAGLITLITAGYAVLNNSSFLGTMVIIGLFFTAVTFYVDRNISREKQD